jgi:CheY-like chemotaxis protein
MMGGPLILIVDDDEDILDIGRTVLQDHGYEVEVASDARSAFERLRSPDDPVPGLLLVDLRMPVVDGATLVRQLEASTEFPSVPIVIMTALRADFATSTLPYPVLRKPFDLDSLLRIVARYCPRIWDEDEPPTDEDHQVLVDRVADDATPRQTCSACDARASTRCTGCGEAYCRRCLDAGPDGRCARCWHTAHP